MEYLTTALIPALWFGVLTSISPCPLATNIAAISFISKKVESTLAVLLSGLFYTLGRMIAYMLVAIIVVYSLLSVPEIARFLSKYMNLILGPLLVIVGVFLLDLIPLNFGKGVSFSQKFQDNIQKKGLFGAFLLGFIFALTFCPVSAGLFFGTLIPLSLANQSSILLPLIYGLGTAIPVIIFAFIIGFSANMVGKMFKKLTKFEYWARKVTGVVFILIGIYLSYTYIF